MRERPQSGGVIDLLKRLKQANVNIQSKLVTVSKMIDNENHIKPVDEKFNLAEVLPNVPLYFKI